MSLILSGTDGLSDVDGSAATPAIRGTDANTGIFFPAADTIAFSEGGVESMRIDSSGNVGIGTASPTTKLDNTGSFRSTGATDPTSGTGLELSYRSTYGDVLAYNRTSSAFAELQIRGAPVIFGNAGGERMRIDSSGNVGIGTASPSAKFQVDSSSATYSANIRARNSNFGSGVVGAASGILTVATDMNNIAFYTGSNLGVDGTSAPTNERMRIDSSGNLVVGTTSASGNGTILTLKNPSNATVWGAGPNTGGTFLVYNASGVGVYLGSGATSWSASSDERTKTTIVPFENALEKVCTLRAGTGRYLKDEETVSRSFLIAQDVQAVLPEAVNVQDDEIGTLGLQYTDVIPLLVAAIKEQQALILSLTTRITALETP